MSEIIKNILEKQTQPENNAAKIMPSYPFLVWENDDQLGQLENILSILRQSKTGLKLINDAQKHKTEIRLDPSMRAYGSYDEVSNNLKVNANCDLNRQVGTMAHELRHAQQFQKGILMDAYLDTPKCYIQNQSVIEADASATATAVCFELALNGNDKPLESLREKDPHIVNPFQNQVVKNGKIDASAYQAAFKGWFTDYSTRDCYDSLYIKMIRQRFKNATKEDENKKFERVVPVNDIVQKVCSFGEKAYLSAKETQNFFDSQDACSVSFERFNAVYAFCYSKFNFDWKKTQEDVMKEKLGLFSRPHYGYMPPKVVPELLPLSPLDLKKILAAEKFITAQQENKNQKIQKQINPILLKNTKTR